MHIFLDQWPCLTSGKQNGINGGVVQAAFHWKWNITSQSQMQRLWICHLCSTDVSITFRADATIITQTAAKLDKKELGRKSPVMSLYILKEHSTYRIDRLLLKVFTSYAVHFPRYQKCTQHRRNILGRIFIHPLPGQLQSIAKCKWEYRTTLP